MTDQNQMVYPPEPQWGYGSWGEENLFKTRNKEALSEETKESFRRNEPEVRDLKELDIEKFSSALLMPGDGLEMNDLETNRLLWGQMGLFEQCINKFQEKAQPIIGQIVERISGLLQSKLGKLTVPIVLSSQTIFSSNIC
jgi:hypothetical protein